METKTERLVQGNEGVGQAATEAEVHPHDIDRFHDDGGPCTDLELAEAAGVAEAVHPVSGEGVEQPQEQPSEPAGPPPGYEQVPPELWPDKDGKPPQLTESLMRLLRRKYFTIRHPRLEQCGHRLDMINEPRTNCENCWWQWFNTHPQLIEVTDQFYRTHGKNALVGMRGTKYTKMFLRFMSTLFHLKKEAEANVANNPEGQNVGGGHSPATLGDGTIVEEAGALGQAVDEGREVESRGISSGIHEQAV